MKHIVFIFLCCLSYLQTHAFSISIITPTENQQNSISNQAIQDVSTLLKTACNCPVDINNNQADIHLVLPIIDTNRMNQPSRFVKKVNYPLLQYPDHDYTWTSVEKNGKIILSLTTPSYQGISFGLYGLLQEQLGFSFYHPKESIIPNLKTWLLPKEFEWKATARFDKKGFHIHSMHPLELTEQLLDPTYPDALKDVKQYIDWLCRNQQNYFEFNLLEGIDLKTWPAYSKQFVDYAHSRGLLAGLDLSLHMIQQKAFKLYHNPPFSIKSKEKQIDMYLEKLFIADWDVWDVEFSSTEFTAGNVKKKQRIQLYLTDKVTNRYNAKLMGRKHVVKKVEELGETTGKKHAFSQEKDNLDKERGILIHTVMFYSISEPNAPVYENENQRHMLDLLMKEKQKRETWYYPESGYWVTFDNSVPIFPLSYLSARLDDILLMDSLEIPGHITFDSGWEWGYWLFDWSIARWSWKHEMNGVKKKETPTMFFQDIFKNDGLTNLLDESLKLHDEYLKDKNLIKYTTAQTVTDEAPGKANIEFHPRPKHSYKWLRNNADNTALLEAEKTTSLLLEFHDKTASLVPKMKAMMPNDPIKEKLLNEITRGLAITSLRAKHRANIMLYLITERKQELTKEKIENNYLTTATEIRKEAQKIVTEQERIYRYSIENIARKRHGHTCHDFGYLFTVSQLHFWNREEQQAARNRYGFLFMNIWDIPKHLGLKK